jgi:hypothetical protein
MKNITTGLALALSTIGLSSTAEAKTVLDASARCFLIGLVEPGGWQQTLKIKPQKALSDKAGDLVQVTALEHGTKAVNPPLAYYNPLTGSATYISQGSQQVISGMTQISLVGTSYGTSDASKNGIKGLYVQDYSVLLAAQSKGAIPSGSIFGVNEFKPIANPEQSEDSRNVGDLTEISCKDF